MCSSIDLYQHSVVHMLFGWMYLEYVESILLPNTYNELVHRYITMVLKIRMKSSGSEILPFLMSIYLPVAVQFPVLVVELYGQTLLSLLKAPSQS